MTDDSVLDARGTRCPVPVVRLARWASTLPPGRTVVLLADDEAARSDVPAWARMRGHAVHVETAADGDRYTVLLGGSDGDAPGGAAPARST